MTRGIAQRFRTEFGCVEDLQSQSPHVGGVVFIRRHDFYVYYIVTKELFFHKPRLDDYVTALHALRDLIVCHRITELSIPQLGCGLDHVPIPLFYSTLRSIFCGDPMTITVYIM